MHPRLPVELGLRLLVDVAVDADPRGETAAADLVVERLAVVALAGDVERDPGQLARRMSSSSSIRL